ncbi:unnamed protein product [Durusdinium trenchii]|uniref:Uncharacterized protein n=1 Tax=Durusdinium trenchii TaxID=1381693 RepID=A0ABP0M2T3_9DINO
MAPFVMWRLPRRKAHVLAKALRLLRCPAKGRHGLFISLQCVVLAATCTKAAACKIL